ncbi:DUF2946 domain-containing protein [Paraburkholderia sp. CNPSo 3076]|uniref:DUF2946 domain-containing protein n=1 Tax=Paraburkholderia sp. CNPSo 3076 TaxID=2940936 RepID=UPI002257F522|nr:DUF2946 domain-containing protein [Paraburkholderia sp. CNPSo 3076]MCX5540052.1 DUF2946 domain-containing protein [Paraburkholderia sp. CNPSo 3076]
MHNRRRQKIGAWLGTLAILLSVIAPTVSQVLRGEYGEVGHHAHHSHHHHPAVQVAFDAHAAHAMHHHGSDSSSLCDACPYCALFAHSPALPGVAVASNVARQCPFFPAPLVTGAFRPYTVLTPAQPRAPPAWS